MAREPTVCYLALPVVVCRTLVLPLSVTPLRCCATQVKDLRKEYVTKSRGVFVAARGINMEIEANSITALVGPSGSGVQRCICTAIGFEILDHKRAELEAT